MSGEKLRYLGRRVRPVQQMEAAECGVACLAMVLDYHGSTLPLHELRQRCGTSRDGNSALQLLQAAERLGLCGRGLKLEPEQLGRARLPLILHWELNHFVVLERMKRGRAVIVDPATGRLQADRAQLDRCFSGVALELWPGPGLVRRARPSASFIQYFSNLRRRHGAVLFIMVAGACSQLLGVVPPALSQVLIDEVIRPVRQDWLLPVVVVLIGATCAGLLLSGLYQWLLAHLQTALGAALTRQAGQHLLRMPLEFIESRSRGDLMQRVSSYSGLSSLLTQSVLGVFEALFALALMGLMLAYDVELAALALCIDGTRLLVVRFLREDTRQRAAGEIAARARENSLVLQATSSAETVKAFGLERQLERWYERGLEERMRWTVRASRLSESAGSWLSLFDGAARAAVLGFGGLKVIQFELTLGVFAGFLAIRGLLTAPLASLLSTLEGWLEFRSVLTRTDELLGERPPARGAISAENARGRIELESVGFRYSAGAPWVFRGLSLTIEPGEHLTLVGPSGQGKSTLLEVLVGILRPTEGRVLLDGVDLRHYDERSLARKFGAVLGEPLIVEGSVRENLALRLPEADAAAVCEASRAACFEEIAARMPLGYETTIASPTANLSGGERQRLALARALLCRPDVLFLDEATCFLDAETESRVLENVLAKSVTVVSVAHRPAVIAAATRVLLVRDGRISESHPDQGVVSGDRSAPRQSPLAPLPPIAASISAPPGAA